MIMVMQDSVSFNITHTFPQSYESILASKAAFSKGQVQTDVLPVYLLGPISHLALWNEPEQLISQATDKMTLHVPPQSPLTGADLTAFPAYSRHLTRACVRAGQALMDGALEIKPPINNSNSSEVP